jgi:hypothetical protein
MDGDGEEGNPRDMGLTEEEKTQLAAHIASSSSTDTKRNIHSPDNGSSMRHRSTTIAATTGMNNNSGSNNGEYKRVKGVDDIRHTDFMNPKTMRDKIRCKYWANGRQYHWPNRYTLISSPRAACANFILSICGHLFNTL